MKKAFVSTLLALAAAMGGAAEAQTKPADFAARMPITGAVNAPFYRFAVPLEAYLQSAHGDLSDLRVFDSEGQVVPHARLAAAGSRQETRQHVKLRWFPLSAAQPEAGGATGSPSLDLVVKQAADGTLVEIKSQGGQPAEAAKAPTAKRRGYILDASQIAERSTVRSIELDWEKQAGDFQLLDIEASDDLRQWHTVRSGVQLARLAYEGARIENRRVDLPGLRERYLRLIWREPAAAPQLTQAEVEQVSSSYASAPLVWSQPMAATATPKAGEYSYHLPQPLALTRLRIELPAGNALMPVSVFQPDHQHRYNYSLASTVAYRIVQDGREWVQNEIQLDGRPLQDFILRVDPRGGSAQQGPALSFALEPEQVIFLAAGKAPYLLAVGNKKATNSALAPSTLVPGFGLPESPQIGEAVVNAGIQAQAAEAAPTPAATPAAAEERDWKKFALWAVLVAGVLGMMLMAWQLLRQANQSGKPL